MKLFSVYSQELQNTVIAHSLMVLFLIALSATFIPTIVYPIFTYDVAKMFALLRGQPSLAEYLADLNWLMGIGGQMYLLQEMAPISLTLLKLISFTFTLLALVLCYWMVGREEVSHLRNLFLVASLAIFFQSPTLEYLATYEVPIYAQGFFFGVFLFSFLAKDAHEILEGPLLKQRKVFIYGFIFLLATFVDFRFSFYVFVAFVILFINYCRDINLVKRIFALAAFNGFIVAIPFTLQLYLLPDVSNFKPAHYDALMFSDQFSPVAIASYFFRSMIKFAQSMTSSSIALTILFGLILLLGILRSVRDSRNPNLGLPIYLFACVLGIQWIASLFSITPFGTIRYATFIFPILIIYYLLGVKLIANVVVRRIVVVDIFVGISILTVLSYQIQAAGHHFDLVERRTSMEREVLAKFREIAASGDEIGCDIISEKVSHALGIDCYLVSTWNITRKLGEDDQFSERLAEKLKRRDAVNLFLAKPIGDAHFGYLRDILKDGDFKMQASYLAQHKLYVYER